MICDDTIKHRIKRAQGQMTGVLKMMDNELACEDIVTQLKAIRSSIDKAIGVLTAENIFQTLSIAEDMNEDALKEALQLIIKTR